MAAVDFGDISEAFDTVSFSPQYENEAYLCKETGRIYYCSSDLDDLSDELPEDIRDDRKYIQIPHKKESGRAFILKRYNDAWLRKVCTWKQALSAT
ncbi:MAG: hypothetical protein OXG54_06200 [Gammaproteobacteria bacterium]|nr:hypothetical protein [Gammaproteobacteria bacterium]